MAHQLAPHGDHSTNYLSTHYPNSSNADEFKSSYDDLIDQYAEPYSRISSHQTFRVHTNSIHEFESRGTSHSLDNQSPYNSDKTVPVNTDPSELSAQGYPPLQKQEKVVDNRSYFAKVDWGFYQVFSAVSPLFRFFQTHGRVDYSSSLSSSRRL